MSEVLEDFKQYLPTYLSAEGSAALFAQLKDFPRNIDSRLYTSRLLGEKNLFQGDGVKEMPVTNLPDSKIKPSRVMIISNTCDIDPANPRVVPGRVMYCPIIHFNRFENAIRSGAPSTPTEFFDDIRRQRVSSMFYLPSIEPLGGEGIVLLDQTNNCDAAVIRQEEIPAQRIFTLSDYGFYLFLFKLSIHLTRIREGIART